MALAIAGCGGGGSYDAGSTAPPPPPPPVASTPTITAQPASLTVATGAPATFDVTATGNGTLTYAWRFNGEPLAGAGSSTLSFAAVDVTQHTSAEVYDPTSNTWSPVVPMGIARQSHSAQLLDDGTVLVIGGFNGASSAVFGVHSGERYDPVANQWLPAALLGVARQGFATSLLPDGRVLIVGGAPNFAGAPEFYR